MLSLRRLPGWVWASSTLLLMLLSWFRPGAVLASGDITPPLKVNDYFSRLLSGPQSVEFGTYFKYWDFPSQWIFGLGLDPSAYSIVQQSVLVIQWLTLAFLISEIAEKVIRSKEYSSTSGLSALVAVFIVGLSWLSGITISSPYISALLVFAIGQHRLLRSHRTSRSETTSGLMTGLLLGPVSANAPLLAVVIIFWGPVALLTKLSINPSVREDLESAKVSQLPPASHFYVSTAMGSCWWIFFFLDSLRVAPGFTGLSDPSPLWERYNLLDSLVMTTSWTLTPKNVAEYWSPLVAWTSSDGRFVYGALIVGAFLVVGAQVKSSKYSATLLLASLGAAVLAIFPRTPVIYLFKIFPLIESAFREPSTKFAPVQLSIYTILISIAIRVVLRLGSKIIKVASFSVLITSTLAVMLPFSTGEFISRGSFPDMRVNLPGDYVDLIRFVGQSENIYPTILLPIASDYELYKSGFYGSDELAGQLGGDVAGREVRYADSSREEILLNFENNLLSGQLEQSSLSVFGNRIKGVIVRFDQVSRFSDAKKLERRLMELGLGREIFTTRNRLFVVFAIG